MYYRCNPVQLKIRPFTLYKKFYKRYLLYSSTCWFTTKSWKSFYHCNYYAW